MSKPALPAFFKTPLGLIVSVLVALLAICCGGSTLFGVLNPDPKPSPAVRIPQPAPATTSAAPAVRTTTPEVQATTAPTTKAAAVKTTGAAKPACHPNYSVCLPITGDLDCGEISQRNFRVVGGQDPYRLDRDNDGIACES